MIDAFALRTDTALIESIVNRGFDPRMIVGPEDFLRLLADAEEIDREVARALPLAIANMGHEYGEIGRALTLPVAVGHRWLLRLLDSTTVPLEETAINDAIATLVRRLVPVLQQVVQFEAVVSRSARALDGTGIRNALHDDGNPLLDPWLDRWRLFPVLASLVTLTLTNWIRGIEEMTRALEDDCERIVASLTGTSTPLVIRSIQGDAGDAHLGGRSVMILTFADERRVVFKPKDLRNASVFRELVERINDAGFSTPLRIHRVIVRPTHMWEEYVPHRPCQNATEVGRFYHRMGGWIRLLQVLEGRDFWLDNLIADGEYPVFIDLETIMQPRRRRTRLSTAAGMVQDRLDSSSLITNIVAMSVPIGPGIEGEDLGCFAYPKEFLSPFAASTVPGAKSSGSSRNGYRTWTHAEHAPVLHGTPEKAEQWFSAIENGYREMADVLAHLAPELQVPDGLLDRLCAHPVRTIFRDTWTCVRIIHRSTAPPLLGNYKRRRDFLERMDRDTTTGVTTPDPVIASEVEAMIALDVPFFSAYGDSTAIHPPDRAPVTGFYQTTPRECIEANLRGFTPERLKEDVALLRTEFWTTHRDTPVLSRERRQQSARAGNRSWRSAALDIAAEIASARFAAHDGTASWVALAYHAMANIETLAPIGHDLLSGQAGLAVMFSDLFRATSEERWYELALGTAREVAAGVEQVFTMWAQDKTSFGPAGAPLLGAFTGVGGMLASIKLAADTLDHAELGQRWTGILASIDWEHVLAQGSGDVIGGAAGLALALAARKEWIEQLPASLQTWLTAFADNDEEVLGDLYPPGARARLAGIPAAHMARLLVRNRLGRDCGTGALGTFDEHAERTPAVGDLLAAIEVSDLAADLWHRVSNLAGDVYQARLSEPGRQNEIDAAEISLAMWRASGEPAWRDRARALADKWMSDYETTGSWFPSDLADDRYRLSSVLGLPAIVSVMLRLDDVPSVTSLRTLNWNAWNAR